MSSETPTPGKIITFYSYKGGTGRSMAVANVGYLLAKRPASGSDKNAVLVIDWDLEAPGLEQFFHGGFADAEVIVGKKSHKYSQDTPGLIDFLWNVKCAYDKINIDTNLSAGASHTPEAFKAFNGIMQRHSPAIIKYTMASSKEKVPIYLLKSGCYSAGGQAEYIEKVRNLDWERFFEKHGSFFVHFRQWLAEQYQYILIDSRTGLTDIGDVCTRVMPETIVAVFVPNRQNIDGVIEVIQSAMHHRRRSRDGRSLIVFPLAARVDPTQSTHMSLWRRGGEYLGRTIVGYQPRFEKLFEKEYELDECDLEKYFSDTQVVYDGDYAFGERLAAREGTSDRLTIGYAYERLAVRLGETAAPWEEPDQETYRLKSRRIFFAYAREDRGEVHRLYEELKARGFHPWLDDVDISPGQIWADAIQRAIRQAAVILVCLSTRTVARRGYLQREIKLALEAFAEGPTGSVFLIPVRLDECEVPDIQSSGLSLREIQWIDLWQRGGFERLVKAIEQALALASKPPARPG